ncbi:HlyD family secretion protein [Neorhizobium sp. NCHU2750]|uniref:HlyD family secretion protein n=1 Tax=Neorhizobium sp. NCHU2750 TaxID=1825976 RepID=UPI001FE1CE97
MKKESPRRADEKPSETDGPPEKTSKASWSTIAIMAIVAAVGIGTILYAWNIWPFAGPVVTTEDSYVKGRVTTLAPQVTGYVAEVPVQDYQRVSAGQILVKIDDKTYRQAFEKAQGNLEVAQANLDNVQQTIAQNEADIVAKQADLKSAQAQYAQAHAARERSEELTSKGVSTTAELEQAVATEQTAQASIESAKAAIRVAETTRDSTTVSKRVLEADVKVAMADRDTAQTNLDRTVIRAPRAGQIGAASVRTGQYVTSGTTLMSLVPDDVWVIANFKETQMNHMAVGQPATMAVDALDGEIVRGVVEEISPATGSEFSVLQADNASGNFTKVVQRVPVKIHLDATDPVTQTLRPGMSVRTSVDRSVDKPDRP